MMPDNLHMLANSGLPLGVECGDCRRRALVEQSRLGHCAGNMTELRRLRLRCSACGSRTFTAKVFASADQARAFVPGDGRPAF